jgi:hypothetical protein
VTVAIYNDSTSLSLVSVEKLWNMSLQNAYLAIWKTTVYYMIFNTASDILDLVKQQAFQESRFFVEFVREAFCG